MSRINSFGSLELAIIRYLVDTHLATDDQQRSMAHALYDVDVSDNHRAYREAAARLPAKVARVTI